MSFMHCVGEIEDMDRLMSGKVVSLGGGAAIIKWFTKFYSLWLS